MQKQEGHLKVFRRRDDALYISPFVSLNFHQRVNRRTNLLLFPRFQSYPGMMPKRERGSTPPTPIVFGNWIKAVKLLRQPGPVRLKNAFNIRWCSKFVCSLALCLPCYGYLIFRTLHLFLRGTKERTKWTDIYWF